MLTVVSLTQLKHDSYEKNPCGFVGLSLQKLDNVSPGGTFDEAVFNGVMDQLNIVLEVEFFQ